MQKNVTIVFLLAHCWCGYLANAQNVGINNTGSPAHASAMLDVQATNKGMLVPRMTAAQRAAIATPATGLLVYQTDAPAGFQFYNGTAWIQISTVGTGWALAGNAATAANFVGTTNNEPLRLRANNQEHARLTQRGGLELGMSNFNNLFIGQGAGAATDLTNVNVQNAPNTFIGHEAGLANTTGFNNYFGGFQAGRSNITGSFNSFIGHQAGLANSTGSQNNFMGFRAGLNNTTGNNNHFVGFQAGRSNTTGSFNNFIGYEAGHANTTGFNNHFVGFLAGRSNTTGSLNTFIGHRAGFNNITGANNTFMGHQAGFLNTTGNNNIFIGFQSGLANQTGSGNLFLGYEAGRDLTNPSNQLVIANNANTSLITGNFSTGQVGINISGTTEASAALEVRATDKGMLAPRMTAAQRAAIASPATGLLVYQTDAPAGFQFYNGTAWVVLSPAADALPTIQIGNQKWMSKNLDVAFYRNGDPIPQVTDPAAWAGLTTGAWCYYNNDPIQGNKFGKLYNWYAVNDPRGLAPQGWHVPSDAEWTTLEIALGGSSVAGGKMKEAGTLNWSSPNTGADNSSGWAGLPGTYRFPDGSFGGVVGGIGCWWSSTDRDMDNTLAWCRFLFSATGSLSRSNTEKQEGFSVRCIRD